MGNLTVVFDLDGTLIDTAPDLVLATNHVLETAGYQPVSSAIIRPFISYGSRVMIEKGIQQQGREISPGQLDELFSRLIKFYGRNIAVESRPFPGLLDVLDTLRARGTTMAICTNKREDMARRLMEELEMTLYFSAITGRDTFPMCKPDPEHLFGAIRLAGGEPDSTVMVGDSSTDHATAKAAGIPIIGVTFGYTDVPVTELDCDATIEHYSDFLTALDTVTAR